MEYRPIPDDRFEEYQHVLDYAFRPEQGVQHYEDESDYPMRLGEPRGLFEGEELRSVCKHYFFDAYVRGAWRTLGGVAAVATPPEYRHRGQVPRLMAESLAEYGERGVAVSALWPFSDPYYAQYGWATLCRQARYECAPDALAFARDPDAAFRRVTVDDYADLDPVHRAFGEQFAFTLDRTEAWWREVVFGEFGGEPYVYALERDGRVGGYVAYRVVRRDGDRVIRTQDLVYRDAEARLALLGLLSAHSAQIDRVDLALPAEPSLLALAPDPGEFECTLRTGPMVRLVDAAAALAGLAYPADTDGPVAIGISDPLVPENEGTLLLEVTDGRADVRWDGEADPDVEAGIGTLSQVYAGTHSVSLAREVGDLRVHDPAAASELADLFPPERVGLRQFF